MPKSDVESLGLGLGLDLDLEVQSEFEAELRSRISSFPILVFAGLVKNAGKTTAFNALNTQSSDDCLGLTSIGYDGEAYDALYQHPKPAITVRPDQLILTAECFLPVTPNGYVRLEEWGKHPQFGSWLILRITDPGVFRMAGPGTLKELQHGISRLRHYGATRIHVDGALNRLFHVGLKMIELETSEACNGTGIILSTGAALGNTFEEIIDRTRHILELFELPTISTLNRSSAPFSSQNLPCHQNSYFHQGTWVTLPSVLWKQDWKALIPASTEAIYLKGALTDAFYLALRAARRLPKRLIVRSPAHILLSSNVWNGLKSRGIDVLLSERPSLSMLTLSPWHPLTPIPTERIAESLLPYSPVPLVDIKQQKMWLPKN